MNWLPAKLLSETNTNERSPLAKVGPKVTPSMLSKSMPKVVRSRTRVLFTKLKPPFCSVSRLVTSVAPSSVNSYTSML